MPTQEKRYREYPNFQSPQLHKKVQRLTIVAQFGASSTLQINEVCSLGDKNSTHSAENIT